MHRLQSEDLQDKDVECPLQQSSCGGPRLHTVILYEQLDEYKGRLNTGDNRLWSMNPGAL